MAGIRRLSVNKARQLNEDVYMIVEMLFDDIEAVEVAMASPERAEAAKDRFNFPNFYGTIRHQVLEICEYPIKA
jgi:uncharacterized protein (TIGR02118 family)